jgi:GLPGLI family protein
MFNIYFSTLLFWVFSFNLYAQNSFEISYKVFPKDILENKKNLSQQTIRLVEKGAKYSRREDYILEIDNSSSYFYKVSKLNAYEDPLSNVYESISESFTNFNNYVYHNLKENYVIFNKDVIYSSYSVRQRPINFNWKIISEYKKLKGLNVQKAKGEYNNILTGKRIVVHAWFTNEISISTGPDIFMGLPGLIVELDLPRSIIKISKIDKKDDIKISYKTNEKEILSRQQFDKIISNSKNKIKQIKYE